MDARATDCTLGEVVIAAITKVVMELEDDEIMVQ